MRNRGRVIRAVFLREFSSYLTSPTGYVFVTLFVFLSAVAAFWQESFFAANLANLDQLNRFFPYLLVFLIPAIAMGLWAEEKKRGTDELLLTLPAGDLDLVLGKYLAGLAIYTVALLFSLSNVAVLCWLGNPDRGLLLSTYLGYWLMGASLLALGMFASQLTDNLTVAFILGAVFCSAPVFLHHAGTILTGETQRLAERLSFVDQFRDLSAGVITLSSVVYFVSFGLAMLYLNVALIGRRRWPSGRNAVRLGRHYLVRGLSLLVIVAGLTTLASRLGGRADITSERIHSLSNETRALIRSLDPRQPVFIQAYLSPDVPRSYVEVRRNLVSMLREFEAMGNDRIHAKISETVKYSPQAREARERFGIQAYRVPVTEESAASLNEIYLGLAFTCGPEEFVIPFFDRGLPVEYELMRSIRVVSRARRKKVGIVQTPARLFGSFDFQTRTQSNDWSIVAELRKQYEVSQVSPDSDYPQDLDALIVALPSALTQPQIDRLTSYVRQGRPVLLAVDPLPAFNLGLAPGMENAPANPLQPAAPATAKGNIRPLLDLLGIVWPADRIVWDSYNPHPQLKSLPPEVVFIAKGNQANEAFQSKDEVTSGLQEVVLLYPGMLRPRTSASTEFLPLLKTGKASGALRFDQLVERTLFGVALRTGLPHTPDKEGYVVAARIKGKTAEGPVNAIVIADVDMMGEQFFELRRRGVENLNFDNVTFLLNAVDELAGDKSFIALRKRRPRHRTLEAVEAKTRVFDEQRLQETQLAQATADQRLKEAQARFDAAVREVQQRTDVDEQTKQIMISNIQSVENRRLAVARANIEDERLRQIELSRANMEASVRGIQNTIKLVAVVLPPIPAFLLFVFVSLRRLRRERIGVLRERLVEQASG
jgi:ABC-2 type transport system permease protein